MSCLSKKSSQQGFTLIEMMVVVAIFIITTGIVLSNFSGFREKSSLDLLAREMALVIRQAQVYGTATKVFDPDETTGQFPSYGVYVKGGLEQDLGNGRKVSYFLLFADKDGDGEHDNNTNPDLCGAGPDKECVEQFNLYGGAKIKSVYGCWWGAPSGIEDEHNTGYNCEEIKKGESENPEGLNVVFSRPEPGAIYNVRGGSPFNNADYSYAKITIEDQKGQERDIYVWRTGHIYVQSDFQS